jgi:hypothetical protein
MRFPRVVDTELAGPRSRWKDVHHASRKHRSYTAEYKVEAAHRVIDTDRTISEAECLTYQGVFTVFGCRTGGFVP